MGGIGKHKGKWSMTCKAWGWNTTHTLGFHTKWAKNPQTFSLPVIHVFWTKSGRQPPVGGGSGIIASATAALSAVTRSIRSATSLLSARVGLIIAQYKTELEDGQFASFLNDFKRVLN